VHINFKEKESMNKASTKMLSKKRTLSTKLVMGMMVAAVSVLVSTAGVANAMPGHGNGNQGYGGGNTINVNVGDIVGDNNIVYIVINYFAGH
jgi:hypothetical protein